VATHKAWSDQSEGQGRRRDPLCALALEGLTRFLDDGHVKLDNCPVDIIVNRKNALFAGSDGGINLQAERRRSARLSCYVDGHDVELWEGTRQVALPMRSNLPL
jgi:hypothetical protein